VAKAKAQPHPGQAAQLGLTAAGDSLDPAEGFLDPLTDALAGGMPGAPCRPLVDRRAAAVL
jgi:hypothetical protein